MIITVEDVRDKEERTAPTVITTTATTDTAEECSIEEMEDTACSTQVLGHLHKVAQGPHSRLHHRALCEQQCRHLLNNLRRTHHHEVAEHQQKPPQHSTDVPPFSAITTATAKPP